MFINNRAPIYRISLNYIKQNFDRSHNIVIHHGLMGSCRNFRTISRNPVLSSIANSYLIDARNHGSSPHAQTHTVQDLADDLYQFLKEHNLMNRNQGLTLMGHSMGGMALMQFTKRYCSPEIQELIDRIIIIDISASSSMKRQSYVTTGQMLKRLLKIDMSLPLGQINKEIDARAINPDVAALIKSQVTKQEGQDCYKWKVNLQVLANKGYQSLGQFTLAKDNPKKWQKPVELIYGEKSEYFDENEFDIYRQFYPQMNETSFHKIENAKHWVHFDNPKRFLQVVSSVMKRK